jgi:hypothetical protein
MSTQTVGQVIDETNKGYVGLHVEVREQSGLTGQLLGSSDTDNTGHFTVSYSSDPDEASYGIRTLVIRILSPAHRVLWEKVEFDIPGNTVDLNTISIKQGDAKGFLVTLGTGAPTNFSASNAIRILIDNQQAWAYVGTALQAAKQSVEIMQLEFDIPGNYDANQDNEKPDIVLQFDSGNPLDGSHLRAITSSDSRLERGLLSLTTGAGSQVQHVRILICVPKIDYHAAIVLLVVILIALIAILLPPLLFFAADCVAPLIFQPSNESDVANYFKQAAANAIDVETFAVSEFNRVHAKLVMIDGGDAANAVAVVVASPFIQGYWDTPAHLIDEPRRGMGEQKYPVHDISIAVRGPAVADMQTAFKLHWETSKSSDVITVATPAAITSTTDVDEQIAPLQLVRTLSPGAFKAPDDKGEQGVLEAYLRAIAEAQQYIYFENQYFTNETIASALVEALKANSKLQAILLMNVTPDIPCYPTWQVHRIKEMRKALGANASSQIEFFTLWSHEVQGGNAKIIPNYIHAKVAIVDGKWATIGSGNLDGASLDHTDLLLAIQIGTVRNHELNYCILNDDPQRQTIAIDKFRCRLWAEHLGLSPNANDLSSSGPSANNWLGLFTTIAKAKLAQLTSDPTSLPPPPVGRILAYGPDPQNDPHDYLAGLGVKFDKLTLVPRVRAFSFKTGAYIANSENCFS